MINKLLYRIYHVIGRKLAVKDGGHFEYTHRSTSSGGEMIEGVIPSGVYKVIISKQGYKLRLNDSGDSVEVTDGNS